MSDLPQEMSDSLCVVGSWFGKWYAGKRLWLCLLLSEVSLFVSAASAGDHPGRFTNSHHCFQAALVQCSNLSSLSQHAAIAMSSTQGLWWELSSLISSWPSSSRFLYSASRCSTIDRGTLTVSSAFLFLMSLFYFTHTFKFVHMFKQVKQIHHQ